MQKPFIIPADVPLAQHEEFRKNYTTLTHGTERFFIFAADHKIEHLDTDFHGPHIDPAAHDPQHLFAIASKARIGALATQLGLIARFESSYPNINYIVKLNSKTNIIPLTQKDPLSRQLWSVDDVITFKNQSRAAIRGIGLTVYLGSDAEDIMLKQAAQAIYQAHQHGLIAMLWIYPRGKNVENERDAELLAGAAGVAASLGADIVKLHPPQPTNDASSAELLRFIVEAAGNTKVICAGGTQQDPEIILQELEEQLTIGQVAGAAIGRNIYQRSLEHAVTLANAIATLIYGEGI